MADLSTRYGVLSVPDADDDIIVRFLRRYGEWAWDETCFIADNLREGARVADIGAFLGTFGLGLAGRLPLSFVCFVEPNSALVPFLQGNVKRNCTAEAAVVEAAIAPIGYELAEGLYNAGNLGSLAYRSRARAPGSRIVNPPAETMDLAALRVRFGEFDLVKVDAEGLELDILRAELPALAKTQTALWVEANECPETLELAATLIDAGMNVHYFAFSSFNPDNFRADDAPIFPFAYEAGLFARVGAPPILSEALRAHQPILKPIRCQDDLKQALWATPRWGMTEWVGRTLPEVVALAGRELRGQAYHSFLDPLVAGDPYATPIAALKQRLHRTEEGLRHAESLAFERMEQLRRLEESIGHSASLALERLALVSAERERVRERDAQISRLQGQLQAAETAAASDFEQPQATEAALRKSQEVLLKTLGKPHTTEPSAMALSATLSATASSLISRATGLARRLIAGPFPKISETKPRKALQTGDAIHENARDVIGDLFDSAYYLEANEDVRGAGMDPLRHYLEYGWQEGRNPSQGFDTRYYLAANPDVAAQAENPLLHFARIGAAEGRKPVRPRSAVREQVDRARPPREQAKDWQRRSDAEALDLKDLHGCLVEFGAADAAGLVLSLSHDEYTITAGGVQNCISDEAASFPRMGWIYLHGCPAQPLPMLADEVDGDAFRLILTANGTRLGEFRFSELAAELAALRYGGLTCWLVIHHMLGHSPELVAKVGEIVGAGRTIVWIHDFFTLCPNWVLMRNDVAFCSAPDPASVACGICCYGEERRTHLERMQTLFDAVVPVVLGPSRIALDFWRERSKLRHASTAIVPPCRVVLGSQPDAEAIGGDDRPLRVAFIGSTTYLKGWHVFDELARRHRGDSRYLFYELNARRRSELPYVHHIKVDVGPQNRMAMVDAISAALIDVVILWSLCKETFSFTAHEAIAAGAAIVTRQGAGNIVAATSAIAPGQVWALHKEEELFDSFESGRIGDLAVAENRRRGALVFGGHTADYVLFAKQPCEANNV